jgi:hypothetical protein
MEAISQQITNLKNQLAELEQLRIKEEQNNIKKALHHDTLINNNFNNIRIELFKRKFGYWKKVQDDHYNIDRQAWKRLRATYNGFKEQYITDFPDEIISKNNEHPEFNFAISQGFSMHPIQQCEARHYKDSRNGNNVTYHYITNKIGHPNDGLGRYHSASTLQDLTLQSILYSLEDLNNRVSKFENN